MLLAFQLLYVLTIHFLRVEKIAYGLEIKILRGFRMWRHLDQEWMEAENLSLKQLPLNSAVIVIIKHHLSKILKDWGFLDRKIVWRTYGLPLKAHNLLFQ